jgi:anti-sigma regulatory factor (Ser/Thr protein kinase)
VVGGGGILARAMPRIGPLTGMPNVTAREAAMPGSWAGRQMCSPAPPLPSAPAYGMADAWPLRTFLELGPLPGAVPCARLHTRQVLWEWSLTRLSESAELVVSELVTNAVAASVSMAGIPPVRLWLVAAAAEVMTLVWDASPRPPARAEIACEAEHGRGLLLVDAISERWNWYIPERTGGKVVWALLACPQKY